MLTRLFRGRQEKSLPMLEFDEGHLEMHELVGVGGFGEVWKCKATSWKMGDVAGRSGTQDDWKAVKIVRQKDLAMALDEAHRMQRAVEVAMPDFVPMFWFCSQGRKVEGKKSSEVLGICMEYIDGCSLSSVLRHTIMSYRLACVAFQDLSCALGRLHEHGIVHNDVKADNILVKTSGECYLCDFGISIFLEDYPEGRGMPKAGTAAYMAPEVWFPNPRGLIRYDTKFDVWSAGIVGYELAVGHTPWQAGRGAKLPENKEIFSILQDIERVDLSKIPNTRLFDGPRGAYALAVHRCLQVPPQDRPSIREILDEFQWIIAQAGVADRKIMARECHESGALEAAEGN